MKSLIPGAFAGVPCPGEEDLVRSEPGVEPALLAQRQRWDVFSRRECEAIVAYLRVREARDWGSTDADRVRHALAAYWLPRLE